MTFVIKMQSIWNVLSIIEFICWNNRYYYQTLRHPFSTRHRFCSNFTFRRLFVPKSQEKSTPTTPRLYPEFHLPTAHYISPVITWSPNAMKKEQSLGQIRLREYGNKGIIICNKVVSIVFPQVRSLWCLLMGYFHRSRRPCNASYQCTNPHNHPLDRTVSSQKTLLCTYKVLRIG